MITLAVITKNEEKTIRRCIESCLPIIDDVIVLDSGSTDSTTKIVNDMGIRVLSQTWTNYGRQKRKAVSLATHDWVLCLDADEYLSEELRARIKELDLTSIDPSTAFSMNRCNRFLGRWIRHGTEYPDRKVRLFNRRYANWSDIPIHETVICGGSVSHIDADILHDRDMTISQYIEKTNLYTDIRVRSLADEPKHKLTHKLFWHMLTRPLKRFLRSYVIRFGFLDGVPGFAHASMGAVSEFFLYLKVYESVSKDKRTKIQSCPEC